MKNFLRILNSTIFLVLFCFLEANSLPLTRTCYTLPEEKVDIALGQELIYSDNLNRLDYFTFSFGLPEDSSFGFNFSLIHNYNEIREFVPGDILFSLWHFFGDYFSGNVSYGINLVIRIPSGPDVYTNSEVQNISYGHNELTVTPVVTFTLSGYENIVLNMSYTFREGRDEDMYSGFNINPLKEETYKSILGLNPFSENAFLNIERIKNDYVSISAGLITSRFLPWIFIIEMYYSTGFKNRDDIAGGIDIEGSKANPLLLSGGVKYFFSDSLFVQAAEIVTLVDSNRYIKNRVALSLNIFF